MRQFSPFRWLAPAGAGGRLSIFIFHRVLERSDPLRPGEPDASRFECIVRFIATHFQVLALAEAAAALVQGRLPAAAACITFDDGYADNLTLAAPILLRHGATATVFVATAYTDGGRMWNDTVIEAVRAAPTGEIDWRDFDLGVPVITDDASRRDLVAQTLPRLKYHATARRGAITDEMARRAGLPARSGLMLSRDQLRAWRGLGFGIGGHTVHHPILARLSDADAAAEIGAGREQLAQWLGEAPRAFAYPNGVPERDYGARDVALVRRAGYACAVSTAYGAAKLHADVYQLPRFMPWDRSMWAFGLRCARTLVAMRRAAASGSPADNMEVRT
jgi:peptidoglycan/xylan/chitin deacetylase (PgdA/CDA1 family)